MKICVYAICKNEIKYVDRWLKNMSEADYIVVLDTGSTDGTFEKLKTDPRVTQVEQKVIKPWRFDVARNESMKLIPDDADILVCTDFDELFNRGWAEIVRIAWKEGKEKNLTRLCYTYAWSHDENGKPTNIQLYDKIHNRDYVWKYPVHEGLYPITADYKQIIGDLRQHIFLEHFRDETKPRSSYFDLLKLAVEENPDDTRMNVLLAREYMSLNDIDSAMNQYYKTLKILDNQQTPSIEHLLETLNKLCILNYQKNNYAEALACCNKFLTVDNTYREPYLCMGEIYNNLGQPELAIAIVNVGLKISKQHFSWIENPLSWTTGPDLILNAAYTLINNRNKSDAETDHD